MEPGQAVRLEQLRAPIGAFRAALIAVCALLSIVPHQRPMALLVLLPLALAAWSAFRMPAFAHLWGYVDGALTVVAVPWVGGAQSPLLPYLLASGFALGLTTSLTSLGVVALITGGMLLITTALPTDGTDNDYLVAGLSWVLLALAVGLIAGWSRRLALIDALPDAYGEVRQHLQQLRGLTRHLPAGLDAGTAAQALLERCARVVGDRSAVLAENGSGVFVPLAVRGADRVPWRGPTEDGPLKTAWSSGRPAVDHRRVDVAGRRSGSTLLALPLLSEDGPFGLVVVEILGGDRWSEDAIAQLAALVAEAAPQLETALLFEEMRLEATTEERDRLAREMHDGMAQEIAYVGYQLDDLRLHAAKVDPELAKRVQGLRAEVTSLISDLRLSITDLRATVRPERGLGEALGTYLRAVCAGRDLVLNLSLQESPLRLPVDQEVALLRLAQLFAQEVRRSSTARELSVNLVVDPPSALMTLRCDAPLAQLQPGVLEAVVRHTTAEVRPFKPDDPHPKLEIRMKGSDHDDGALGGRPRTDPAGVAAGIRAD